MKGFTSLPRSLGLFFYFGGLQQEIVFLVRKTLRSHLFLRRCFFFPFFLRFILFGGWLSIKYIYINESGRKSQIIQQTSLITIQVWQSCYFCSLATESFMFLWVRKTLAMSSPRNIYLTGITSRTARCIGIMRTPRSPQVSSCRRTSAGVVDLRRPYFIGCVRAPRLPSDGNIPGVRIRSNTSMLITRIGRKRYSQRPLTCIILRTFVN